MSMQNQIFQVQNAIFQTLSNANIGVDIIANRGICVQYPYIIILGTTKVISNELQVKTKTEINVVTKDFSIISSAQILEKIEKTISREAISPYMEYYSINYAKVTECGSNPNEEGFFVGKVVVEIILD